MYAVAGGYHGSWRYLRRFHHLEVSSPRCTLTVFRKGIIIICIYVYPAPKSAAKSFDLNQDRSSNKDNKTVQSAERNIYHSEIALISSTDRTGFLKSSKSKKEASSAVAITKPNWKGGCFHLNNKQMSNKE